MRTIPLYRYRREDGGITVSPIKPNCEYTDMIRLVADEGKVLTKDGMNTAPCVDVVSAEGWTEIEPIEEGDS